MADSGEQLRLGGLVQGVGMRPTIWRLAHELGLTGSVRNEGDEVVVQLWGPLDMRECFAQRVRDEAPPLASIRSFERTPLTGAPVADFRIIESRAGAVHHGALPDAATCPACQDEIRDPAARRYRHAFANCTHCGPRLSLLRALPYDRARTSMAVFPMCAHCAAEFRDPGDRRFHAQPIACPNCGPRLWLEDVPNRECARDWSAIEQAAQALAQGRIVAVKGIGGFHLAVDACNAEAVARLRQRKHRPAKPFALMAADVAMIARYCPVEPAAEQVLQSSAAPIVLLEMQGSQHLPELLAPQQRKLGFMVPHSPLHHLLMQAWADQGGGPLVMTSGNRSSAPPCTDNDDARDALAGIADCWLMHDREVVNRIDDSVLSVQAGVPRMLRRSRGYAPAPLPLPAGFAPAPVVLAMGAQLKNCFGLSFEGQAVLSQHLGDLHDAGVLNDYRRAIGFYRGLCGHTPAAIAVDQHPDYAATRHGRELAAPADLPVIAVQHHHAHAAACMAENAVPLDAAPVLALVLDGSGYGDDGTVWGGELLRCDYRTYQRLGRLRRVGLPGAAAAIREPWRCAYAYLRAANLWPLPATLRERVPQLRELSSRPWKTLDAMLERGLNSPRSSSAGRLFDAVAALLGVCPERISYEGEAAMALEALADANAEIAYPFVMSEDSGCVELDWAPMFAALLNDLNVDVPRNSIAARFHLGLAQALCEWVRRVAGETRTVVLSGGVFQNAVLLEGVTGLLRDRGFAVLSHQQVPSNDGGLALGQLAIAAARMLSASGDFSEITEQAQCA